VLILHCSLIIASGDWQNYFTEDQARRLDELYEREFGGIGLKFDEVL
jgi:hypothetical protein